MDRDPPREVGVVIDAYPPEVRKRILELRRLIFATASATEGVGRIEETLRWGEPAYLTPDSRSGSTIRIAPRRGRTNEYGIFFNCQTDLVETFRHWFPRGLKFEGNRAIVLHVDDRLPIDALAECIEAALTYRLRNRRGRRKGGTDRRRSS